MTEHDDADVQIPAGLDLALDSRDGPARRVTRRQADRMVAAAVQAWAGGSAAPPMLPPIGGTGVAAGGSSGRLARSPRWLPFVGAGALATSLLAGVIWLSSAPAETPREVEAPIATPVVTVSETPHPVAVEAPIAAPSHAAPRPRGAVPSRPSAEREAEAEDLLAEANALRRQERWSDADEIYRRVATRYVGTLAAYAGEVASGSLRLEHLNDAAGAQRAFRHALRMRPDGALDAEVRWGLARSLRALGDTPMERAALSELVGRHGRTSLGARGAARLAEIEAQ